VNINNFACSNYFTIIISTPVSLSTALLFLVLNKRTMNIVYQPGQLPPTVHLGLRTRGDVTNYFKNDSLVFYTKGKNDQVLCQPDQLPPSVSLNSTAN
jgi:hypothetical protein